MTTSEESILLLKENMGTRRMPPVRMVNFPNTDEIVRKGLLDAPAVRRRWTFYW